MKINTSAGAKRRRSGTDPRMIEGVSIANCICYRHRARLGMPGAICSASCYTQLSPKCEASPRNTFPLLEKTSEYPKISHWMLVIAPANITTIRTDIVCAFSVRPA